MTDPDCRSPDQEATVRRVLDEYGISVRAHVEWLGTAGGFSGALFWRITDAAHAWCLRRWPKSHPQPDQLGFIHRVLDHVASRGFTWFPRPERTRDGSSYTSAAGHLWELSPWLAGQADFRQSPNRRKLENALQTLARFHLAAASFPSDGPRQAPSPNLIRRLARLRDCQSDLAVRLQRAVMPGVWPELFDRARRILTYFAAHAAGVEAFLEQGTRVPVELQPCLRDVWHAHVLFCGDEVSGLVDFGALQIDSVVGDLARLLGSLAGKDRLLWQAGLAAYQSLRPLSPAEHTLLPIFDQSEILLSGMNWLEWIYLEGTEFPDRGGVLAKVDEIIARMMDVK